MAVELEFFRKEYATSLKAYLRSGSEEALKVARDLGQRATNADVHLVDLAAVYQETLHTLLERQVSPGKEPRLVQAANTFFLETITALELSLRSLREANESMRALSGKLHLENKRLDKRAKERTAKLKHSMHLLQKEVTQRQQAQWEQQQVEAQYRRLIHTSRAPVFIFASGTLLYVNPAGARYLGAANPHEFIGASLSTILLPEEIGAILERISPMPEHEVDNLPIQAKLVTLDGTEVDVEMTATAVYYEGRTAVQLVCYDLIERTAMELAEREQRSLAEALAASAAQLNKTLKFDEVLERALVSIERVLPHDGVNFMLIEGDMARIAHCRGYRSAAERDAIVGLKLLVTEVVPLRRMWESQEPIVISDTAAYVDWLRLPPTAWIRSYVAAPIVVEGETIAFLNADSATPYSFKQEHGERLKAFADQVALALQNARLYEKLSHYSASLEQAVQERTQELEGARNRLQTILDSVGDALLVLDQTGCIEQVNPAFERQTGYSAAEVVHHHFVRFLPNLIVADAGAVASGDDAAHQIWRDEIKIVNKNGLLYDASITVAPLLDAQGKAAGHVAALVDVSPLKEVARMKDAFVANVSHELRTPITSLKLNYSLAKLNVAKSALYIDRVGRDIDRLNTLIEDLLRLSRLEQGRVELRMRTVNLNTLARQYVEDRRPLADSNDLMLTFHEGAELPLVEADAGLLEQVISIFLTNALNYTPPNGAIDVRTGMEAVGDQIWAGISVRDTGPGLTAEDKVHLFERFYRGKTGRNAGVPGTGLGLNIALEIVNRHGGRIDVESEGVAGKGSTFTVWLRTVEQAVQTEYQLQQLIAPRTSKYFSGHSS